MSDIKTLHSFSLQDSADKTIKFVLKDPSRKDWHEITKFYRVRFNQLQREGFLTKAMIIANSEVNGNGLLSSDNIKKLESLRIEIQKLQGEAIEAQLLFKDDFAKLEEKTTEINSRIAKTNSELVSLEGYYQSSFDNSAEVLAESDTIQYILYYFTYVDRGAGLVEYFPGKDFTERQNKDFEYFDSNDEVYNRVKDKLLTFVTLFFKGIIKTKEDFETLENRFNKLDTKQDKNTTETVAEKPL